MADHDLLIVAGEASGDLHAARLLSELLEMEPGLRPFGLGGDELRNAGLDPIAHSSEISVMGISEALRVLRRARVIYRQLLEEVDRRRPRVAVLVDFAEFNLRLAAELHARGVRVVYYSGPQVWAWRSGRVKNIARTVERMLVLFPFEVDFYRRHGVTAVHVGHPLVDEVPSLDHIWDRGLEPETFEVALLPGSRRSETSALLPVMVAAAERLAEVLPVRFRLIRAPTIAAAPLAAAVDAARIPIEIVDRDRFSVLADSHLALCASGTATLEVGLIGTPMLVVYRVSRWSSLVGRMMVKLPHYSLVNLVLGRAAVPELLQGDAVPGRLAAEAAALLGDRQRLAAMRGELAGLRGRLGHGGGARRAALEVRETLREAPS